MFHGLLAYRREYGIHALLRRADIAVSGVTLSTSNRAIGKLGLFIDGKISRCFGRDCWSKVREGHRVIDDDLSYEETQDFYWRHDGLTSKEWECESVEEALKFHKACRTPYAEFFESCTEKPRYVWVKRDASEWFKKAARILARRFEIDYFEIPESTDIAVGSDCEPDYYYDQEYLKMGLLIREDTHEENTRDPELEIEYLEEKLCGY